MQPAVRSLILFFSVALVAGCGPTATAPVAPPVVAAIPAGTPPVAGAIAGSLGSSLSEADRRVAADAQYEALEKGQRRSWKARSGTTFGFVEPGPESGSCREYTHTVYVDGRPQSGKGQGCRQPDGSWKV